MTRKTLNLNLYNRDCFFQQAFILTWRVRSIYYNLSLELLQKKKDLKGFP